MVKEVMGSSDDARRKGLGSERTVIGGRIVARGRACLRRPPLVAGHGRRTTHNK